MGIFKKVRRFVHPGSRLFDKRGDGNQGAINMASSQAHQADLDAAMKDYEGIEGNIKQQYTDAARRAGTYADTPEFQSGLGSEIQAGVRGARTNAVARINAMRRAMGINEDFNPEGYNQTQANNTAEKLANAPSDSEAQAPQTPAADAEKAAPEATNNAAADVQSVKPRGKQAVAQSLMSKFKQMPMGRGNSARLAALRQRQY